MLQVQPKEIGIKSTLVTKTLFLDANVHANFLHTNFAVTGFSLVSRGIFSSAPSLVDHADNCYVAQFFLSPIFLYFSL